MQYIVMDLEFNQAYDFENNCPKPHIEGCRFEIIQIGAVKLNKSFEFLGKFNSYIKPKLYEKVHPFVNKVTSITDELLEDKKSFKEEIINFFDFIGKEDFVLCVWGICDIITLYKNLKYYNFIKNEKVIIKYIDVQSLAKTYFKYGKGHNVSLKNATELLEISSSDNFHDALNDALYTAEIFKTIYKKLPKNKSSIKIFNSEHIKK